VILANISDGRKEFALPHESYCLALGRCACTADAQCRCSAPARLVLREGERRFVARAVLSVPEVARAIRRGRLRLEGDRT